MRKFAATAWLAALGYFGESPLFALEYLLRLARVAVLLTLWRTIYAGHASVSGLSAGAVLTYTLIGEVFAEPLNVKAGLSEAMWEGALAMRFLRPFGLVAQFGAETAGRWLIGLLCCSVPLLALAPLLGVDPRPASAFAGGVFLVSLVLAIAVGLALEFIFAGLTAATQTSVWAIHYFRHALTTVLSGAIVPLALLPWGLGGVFDWLPFASMASAPLRLYVGTAGPAVLLRQLAWAALLWLLAHRLWSAGREQLVGYGG